MFKKIITITLFSLLFINPIWSQDEEITTPRKGVSTRKGVSAAHGAYNATAISMMGWGLGLTVFIVTVAALVKTSAGSTNGAHSH